MKYLAEDLKSQSSCPAAGAPLLLITEVRLLEAAATSPTMQTIQTTAEAGSSAHPASLIPHPQPGLQPGLPFLPVPLPHMLAQHPRAECNLQQAGKAPLPEWHGEDEHAQRCEAGDALCIV